MQLNKKKIFLLTFLSLFLSSLFGQYFYIPDNDVSALQYLNRGDLKLSYTYPFNDRTNIQLGYSPLKHISISAGYFKYQDERTWNTTSDFIIKTNGHNYTGAIGFYKYLTKRFFVKEFILFRNISGVILQSHFGYNKGAIFNRFPDDSVINLDYQSFFARGSIHVKYRYFTFGYSFKFFNLDYVGGEVGGKLRDLEWFSGVVGREIENRNPRRLREKMFQIKFNYKFLEIFGAYNVINKDHNFDHLPRYFGRKNYTLGMILEIDDLIKTIKTKKL